MSQWYIHWYLSSYIEISHHKKKINLKM
jgi:hypothetical protein